MRIRFLLLFLLHGCIGLLGAAEVPDRAKVAALVKKLGDEQYSVRQQAAEELRDMGEGAEAPLRKLLNHPDPEVRSRIEGVIEYLQTLRKELKWLDPKHQGKPGYRSQMSGRAVRLTFRNITKQSVRIFWVDTDGSLRPWRGLLNAGESAVCARSYIGHVWLVTDADKKPLGIYRIDIEDPIIAVREQDIKK